MLQKPRVHMLYSHGLKANDVESFRSLLSWLADTHTIVSYSKAVDRIREGRIDQPYVAFSFDDGDESCIRAATILREFDANACFFVCPQLIDEGHASASTPRGTTERLMGWNDLELLLDDGHEIGSHTMTHSNLADASSDRAQYEVAGSFDRLVRRLGDVRHFAWPFGTFDHVSPEVIRLVFSAGYQTCASAVRGSHSEPVDDHTALCIRREHIGFDWPLRHIRYFMARSAAQAGISSNAYPNGWHYLTTATSGKTA